VSVRTSSAIVVLAIATSACANTARAANGIETVHVRIHYSSYEPGSFAFPPGTTVRFVVTNTDPIDHEFIIGDRAVQQAHELGTEAYHPPRPGEMTVPAQTTRTTTYTFGAAGTLIFGCHLPGHYAYGMHGAIRVG
jgi:uncharacterized cupredoxin-like copper-binding protein